MCAWLVIYIYILPTTYVWLVIYIYITNHVRVPVYIYTGTHTQTDVTSINCCAYAHRVKKYRTITSLMDCSAVSVMHSPALLVSFKT